MNAIEMIQKAKVQLILDQPFFASLCLRLQYLPDANIKTSVTNGHTMEYNPVYIESLSLDELKGVIAQEVMHAAMLHHTRRGDRNGERWNQATDYAINPLLLSSGFVLPGNYLINNEYDGKTAEQIYNLLPDPDPDKNNKSGDQSPENKNKPDNPAEGYGGTGDIKDFPPESDLQEEEANMKQAVAQAVMVAKRQGDLPAELQRLINEILKPRIPWQEVLARFVSELSRNDYTWKTPSPRYLYAGIFLPSLRTEEIGSLIAILDTSGSIDQPQINQFGAEIQDIANTFHIPLKIIYVDAEVQSVQDIEPEEPIQLNPIGGGGTDFQPGFDYIDANDLQPSAVIYITDGECWSFPDPPDYPVLWAQFGSVSFNPPFGETIQVL
jgi:predicted metal-dependent peptidase